MIEVCQDEQPSPERRSTERRRAGASSTLGGAAAAGTRFLALARDELRLMVRSRRGRVATITYAVLTLLPLTLALWLRNRFVVPWPVDACDMAGYLRGARLIDCALILVLAHDLLTRGDREGWQDGFATLPVGELTWLFGRAAGRLVFLSAVLAVPRVVGWAVASLWGAPASPAPTTREVPGHP